MIFVEKMKKSMTAVLILAACVMMTSCGKNEGSKVVFTTGLGKNEVFRIGDEICTTGEMMIFMTTTQKQYESVYSSKIWNTELDGVTLEDNVKETVLEKAAQIKSMYLLAKSKGVELEKAEKSCAEAAAKEYMAALGQEQIEEMGVTEDGIKKLFEQYAMAHKVYQEIIQDVNPEISDDEARIITVQHILIKTYRKDANGERVDFLTADKQTAYEQACEIRDEAIAGDKSFEELASRYSQDATLTYSFGKGEMDTAFEAAAFRLETDEISQVIESESGYHIIKCINTFDREETAANKEKLLTERRNEAFGKEYEAFVEGLARKLNQSAWDEIGLIRDGAVPSADFFDIYERRFQNQ